MAFLLNFQSLEVVNKLFSSLTLPLFTKEVIELLITERLYGGYEATRVDSDNEESQIRLQRHFRCTCHTLNLIATNDVNNIVNQ